MENITKIDQLAVKHQYGCSGSSSGDGFDTWEDFMGEWGDCDMDYNLVFRWDVRHRDDCNGWEMQVHIMQQRKGWYCPVSIELVTDGDVASIIGWLNPRLAHLSGLWAPMTFPVVDSRNQGMEKT